MEPLRNDDFYKRIYQNDNDLSQYEVFKSVGYTDNEALNKTKEVYKNYPNWFSIYAGQLPEVVITPGKNTKRKVILDTYYPMSSKYPYTGHSRLITPGRNRINVGPSDPGYNLFLQNCSDATREALEQATGQKINPWFFTTPGDVRSFAEDVLNGESYDMGKGLVRTFITLPQYQINTIAKYAQDLRQKRVLRARQNAEARRKRRLAMAGPYKNIER